VHPAQGLDVIGSIGGASGKAAGCLCQRAGDSGVEAVKAPGDCDCLVEGPEDLGEDDAEGAVKPPDRVGQAL
jgi:hypothetical protein